MISYNEALDLLESHIDNEKIISHSLGVSHYAYNLAIKINELHPSLGIDPSIVGTAALLHDIGKSSEGLHELNSHHLLSSLGHHEFSELVIHGTLYERYFLKTGIWDDNFLPQSLSQKIVAYADLRFNHRAVTVEERIIESKQKLFASEFGVQALDLAEERLFALEKDILDLLE